MLADFGIYPKSKRIKGEVKTSRGYYFHQFEEMWATYFPDIPDEKVKPEKPATPKTEPKLRVVQGSKQ